MHGSGPPANFFLSIVIAPNHAPLGQQEEQTEEWTRSREMLVLECCGCRCLPQVVVGTFTGTGSYRSITSEHM